MGLEFWNGNTSSSGVSRFRLDMRGDSPEAASEDTLPLSRFDRLSVDGVFFEAAEAEVTESGSRFRWPMGDPSWSVGQSIEARFYDDGSGGRSGALDGLQPELQPGRPAEADSPSGYSGAVTCGPFGEFTREAGASGLRPIGLVYARRPTEAEFLRRTPHRRDPAQRVHRRCDFALWGSYLGTGKPRS